jgi:hypothetical protein
MKTRIVLAVYEPWQPSPFLLEDTCQGRYIVNSVISLLEYKMYIINNNVFPSLYSSSSLSSSLYNEDNNDNNDTKMGLIRMYETPEGYFMALPCEYIFSRFQRAWRKRYQQRMVEIRRVWTPKAILLRQIGNSRKHVPSF